MYIACLILPLSQYTTIKRFFSTFTLISVLFIASQNRSYNYNSGREFEGGCIYSAEYRVTVTEIIKNICAISFFGHLLS